MQLNPVAFALFVVALWPAAARALTFDEALALASRRPDVRAADAAAAARAPMDRNLPGRIGNPDLQVGLGPGSTLSGFQGVGTEFQATLLLPVALDDLAGPRRRSAHAERAWLAAEGRRRALEQHRRAARAWLSLWTAQRALAVAREELAASHALVESLARGVSMGAAVRGDAMEAELAEEHARGAVIDAEGVVTEAAGALAIAAHVEAVPELVAEGEPPSPAIPEEGEWPRWIARASSLPEVDAAAWLARAASLAADEATANGTSWFSAGAQVVRNSADQWQLYAMLGVRPSTTERNQRARAQALGAAALAAGEHETARGRASVALALALHEVEHTRSVETQLRARGVPAVERLVAARDESLQRGVGTVFDALRARIERARGRTALCLAEGRRRDAELDAWLLLAALPGRSP